MDFFKAKLSMSILAYGLIVGAIVGAILYYLAPSYYPNWYFEILAFFLILEPLIIAYVESASKKSTQKQLVNVYMLTKVVKTTAALMFIGFYAIAIKENIKSFVLSFMILYLLFLAMEAILFLRIEKRLKEKQTIE